jgi:hypothetical protein
MCPQETPEYGLTKSIWTEADFETMGWHDANLFCFTALNDSIELVMDLDYITRWVRVPLQPRPSATPGRRRPPWLLPAPEDPTETFNFWVAPATLVFRGVQNISAALEIRGIDDVQILDLKRMPLGSPSKWRWRFELAYGHLAFDADGYTQYFRREPLLRPSQSLTFEERGGISYARVTFDGSI